MKIRDIKSDEVRNEAVRLCVLRRPDKRDEDIALDFSLIRAFDWERTPQKHFFWKALFNKIDLNTPELKLPKNQ
jgi:hypothetical protein